MDSEKRRVAFIYAYLILTGMVFISSLVFQVQPLFILSIVMVGLFFVVGIAGKF